MVERVVVKPNTYRDSIALMQVSRDIARLPGVVDASVVSATPLNQAIISDHGFRLPPKLAPDDLVVAVRARTAEEADAAVAAVEEHLASPPSGHVAGGPAPPPRTFRSAVRADPALNLACISVPDRHAAQEISAALDAGLNVFCFSGGVPRDVEAALKRRADRAGLLVMGPDCGTAILDGVGLGFSNVVPRGPVGIAAASGTGIQQTSCLLAAAGVGISQAIGVGSRDLDEGIDGTMMHRALRLLAQDPETEVILALSKPPGRRAWRQVIEWAAETGKPAVVAFLGLDTTGARPTGGVEMVSTLEEAARRAVELAGGSWHDVSVPDGPTLHGTVRGLFCGGSLCYEAMAMMAAVVGEIRSNTPLRPDWRIADQGAPYGHVFIDFGHEELTRGRPHPMLDPSLRNARFVQETRDPDVGVVLLDVVLGRGSHPDPASDLAPLIQDALRERGSELLVAVALCGVEGDPQDYGEQRRRLEASGAVVTASAAAAARVAMRAIGGRHGS